MNNILHNLAWFLKHIGAFAVQFVKHSATLVSKVAAYILYLQICWVYYSCRGVGFVFYLLIFSFGFFNEGTDIIRTLCLLYVAYLFGVIMMINVVLRIKRVQEWVCREVGTERVMRKLYNSPLTGDVKYIVAGTAVLVGGDYYMSAKRKALDDKQKERDVDRVCENRDAYIADIRREDREKAEELSHLLNLKKFAASRVNAYADRGKKISQTHENARLDINNINAQKSPLSLATEYNNGMREAEAYKAWLKGAEHGVKAIEHASKWRLADIKIGWGISGGPGNSGSI